MLVSVVQEDATLPVDGAIGPHDEVVGSVVGIGRPDALQQDDAQVGDIIAVGVLEEEDVGLGGDNHSPVPELEAERIVHLGKLDGTVGHAVAIIVRENHQGVVEWLERLPFGIGAPAGGPQPTLGVDLHLHRVGELRKALLIGEEVDFITLGDVHLLDGLLAVQIGVRTFLLCTGTLGASADIGFHRDRRRHIGVIQLECLAIDCGPDTHIAVGRHHIEHLELVDQHILVFLAVDKGEAGTTTPDIVAIGGAVAVVPAPVFIEHGLTGLFHGGIGEHRLAAER